MTDREKLGLPGACNCDLCCNCEFINSKDNPVRFNIREHHYPGGRVEGCPTIVEMDEKNPRLVAVHSKKDWFLVVWVKMPDPVPF